MKRCYKCQATKPLSEFNRNRAKKDGYSDACRLCAQAATAKWKAENLKPEDTHRYYANHARRRIECTVRMQTLYPEKHKARRALHQAIKAGRIERQPCERCGNAKAHGHHEDYSKPLEVVWLCSTHHAERHKELRDAGKLLTTNTCLTEN